MSEPEFIEPTPEGRQKLVMLIACQMLVILLLDQWLFPAWSRHLQTLPRCERFTQMMGALQTLFLAVPLIVGVFAVIFARKLLRQRQFPLSGAWVWRRTRIQRGRIVQLRAYALLVMSALAWLVPMYVFSVMIKEEDIARVCAIQPEDRQMPREASQ